MESIDEQVSDNLPEDLPAIDSIDDSQDLTEDDLPF